MYFNWNIFHDVLNNLFQLLFQGAAAGLIVVWVTKYLQAQSDKILLQKYALLIGLEIRTHLIRLKTLQENAIDGYYIDMPQNPDFICSYGQTSMIYISGLSLEQLNTIGMYYQKIGELSQHFQRSKAPTLDPYEKRLLAETIGLAEKSLQILSAVAGTPHLSV